MGGVVILILLKFLIRADVGHAGGKTHHIQEAHSVTGNMGRAGDTDGLLHSLTYLAPKGRMTPC